MAANLETMFSVREVPWHGQGTIVQEAPNSNEALHLAMSCIVLHRCYYLLFLPPLLTGRPRD